MLPIVHTVQGVGANSFGVGSVALNLAKEQNSLGGSARIWCLDDAPTIAWASGSSGLSDKCVSGFPPFGPNRLGFSPEMERAARSPTPEIPAVVHQHGIWSCVSRVTSLLRSTHGIPTVVAPHGSLEAWAIRKSWWKKRMALICYERDNLQNASCLQALSMEEVDGFRAFGLRNPIAVIPNGISSSWLASTGDADAFRHQFHIHPGQRILLFLSRIAPVKGLPILLAAMHKIRSSLGGWLLIIAGSDQFGHQAEVMALIKQFGLGSHVLFTGLLLGQAKRDAYAAANVFVLPTRREAAPIVVLEALGAGIPVLTTHGAPWGALLDHQCGWWVQVDADAMAVALLDVLSCRPEFLQDMGQRGKELVASKHSWELSATMTMTLYKWLLGQEERPNFVIEY